MKDCQSNKCEIHQGDKCSGSSLGLSEDISLLKGTGQTRNTTSLLSLERRPHDTKAAKSWIYYREKNPDVLKRVF